MEQVIPIADGELMRALFGPEDVNAKSLRRRFAVDLVMRHNAVKLVGPEESVREAAAVLQRAIHVYERDGTLSEEGFRRILHQQNGHSEAEAGSSSSSSSLPRNVRPRTRGQDEYVQAIHDHGLTFAVGPAGTGKTFLAAAVAVGELQHSRVRKIVLCRPAVEAGERLGFLPGDFQAKVNPYLRPLYDALFSILDVNQVRKYIDNDVIEVAPLAYMRGRTLEKAFIILDEGQNTTPGQMKMFLTRMGRESKVVVTGDITQVDLPEGQSSGLVEALEVLQDVEGIACVRLSKSDIVRHPIVQSIVDAYERRHRSENPSSGGRRRPPAKR